MKEDLVKMLILDKDPKLAALWLPRSLFVYTERTLEGVLGASLRCWNIESGNYMATHFSHSIIDYIYDKNYRPVLKWYLEFWTELQNIHNPNQIKYYDEELLDLIGVVPSAENILSPLYDTYFLYKVYEKNKENYINIRGNIIELSRQLCRDLKPDFWEFVQGYPEWMGITKYEWYDPARNVQYKLDLSEKNITYTSALYGGEDEYGEGAPFSAGISNMIRSLLTSRVFL